MKLEERIQAEIDSGKISPRHSSLQGIEKEKLRRILTKIDRAQPDTLDTVFALLDDTLPSFFAKAAVKKLNLPF